MTLKELRDAIKKRPKMSCREKSILPEYENRRQRSRKLYEITDGHYLPARVVSKLSYFPAHAEVCFTTPEFSGWAEYKYPSLVGESARNLNNLDLVISWSHGHYRFHMIPSSALTGD